MLVCGAKVLKTSKFVCVGLLLCGLVSCAIPAGDSISSPPVPPVIPAAAPAGNSLPSVEVSQMLADPEAQTEDWEDDIWADNPGQAEKRCKELADKYTREGGTVVELVKVRQKNRAKYICTFRG